MAELVEAGRLKDRNVKSMMLECLSSCATQWLLCCGKVVVMEEREASDVCFVQRHIREYAAVARKTLMEDGTAAFGHEFRDKVERACSCR